MAQAQSLGDQYAYFLSVKCGSMNFARDSAGNLTAGQAGPLLKQYCDGDVGSNDPVPGTFATTASTGSAVTGRADEAAVRRRTSSEGDGEENAGPGPDGALSLGGRHGVFASLKHDGETRDPTSLEGGHRANLLGLTVGIDRRLTSSSLIGAAAVLEDQSGQFDAGGEFDHRGYGLLLYGSWLPAPEAFVELTAGTTLREASSRRMVSFERTFTPANSPGPPIVVESIAAAPVSSDVDQRELMASVQAGYDIRSGGSAVGPRLALQYRRARIDATVESGDSPMALVIDPQTRKSLRTGIGLEASRAANLRSAVMVVQLNAEWWHEFRDDQRIITARFAEDLRPEPSRLQFQNEAPDRDVFVARASLGVTLRHGWSAFAAVEALLGHSWLRRYGAAIGVRKEL
jgi:uncharacterized protein YhjY with autotransporter beta-barrel domain